MSIIEQILNDNNLIPEPEIIITDKEKCRTSLIEFANIYLSDFCYYDFSSFHYDIATHFEDIILNKKNERTYSCIISPRGHAKSFWASFALPLWCICYKHTDHIMIVTDSGDLSKQFVVDIKMQLETNEKIIKDFGELKGKTIWQNEKILCSNGVAVSSKGSGAAIRGAKIMGKRPSLIICDDILNEENSNTPEQRKKLYDWYMKTLCPTGDINCSIVVVGTILNDACLLNKMLTEPEFSEYYRRKYQAVIEFSDSPLWEEWEKILHDLSRENPVADADAFYFKHKEEMTKGIQVLWDREPDMYMKLMKIQAQSPEAFSCEYQNDPLLEENREFKEEWIQANFYNPEDLPMIKEVYIGVDAAATAKLKSDNSAIAVVGRAEDNYLYVLESFVKKVSIDTLVEQLILYSIQYQDKLVKIRVETTVFQTLLVDIMKEKSMQCGLYLPFEEVNSRKDKELRIRSLIVPVKNGYLKFNREHKALLEEMRRFPVAKHDDALDSLHLAVTGVIGGANAAFSFSKISIKQKNKSLSLLDLTKRWW